MAAAPVPVAVPDMDPSAGLDAAAVAVRVAAGQVNRVDTGPSRSVAEIVRANVLTRFNALLGSLFIVILFVGPPQDGLFGIVLVLNTAIGLIEELRARRTLERLAVLSAPRALVLRDGERRDLPVDQVVLDDVIEIGAGDQVVVDGVVLRSDGLEIDESLLTGEADTVAKGSGEPLLSGSFVAAGTGAFQATRVGRETYAAQLTAEAKRFALARSELRAGINRILRVITWVLAPLALLLLVSQLRTHSAVASALRASVGGVVAMVPEGLVLLTSMAFAVAVTRLARRRVLVQELAAVEALARVDVLCVDKTGTLTEGELEVDQVVPLDAEEADVRAALGALAAADPRPNASLRAVAAACSDPGWAVTERVPFSSARKWSGADFGEAGAWVLGAPDVLLPGATGTLGAAVERLAGEGRRVLAVAAAPDGLPAAAADRPLRPAGYVVLRERLRPDAPEILAFLRQQGVTVKVISGDHPRTVAAVARQVGLSPEGPVEAMDARDLPDDAAGLADAVEAHAVFGRVTPAQKRAMVASLRARGHVVAMTGDGVNDVLALKDADLGIAMGSGSAASRGVAQIVLLENAFATLPHVLAEGRRVIANIERVAQLFLTKTVYAMVLAVVVGLAGSPFPFLPRHLTLVASLTIGTPAFFLSLAPNAARAQPGFVRRALRFAAPAGVLAATATFLAYLAARETGGVTTEQARTAATLTLVLVGLWVLVVLARPLTPWRVALVAAMSAGLLLAVLVPFAKEFFALSLPPVRVGAVCVALVALAGVALEASARLLGRWTRTADR